MNDTFGVRLSCQPSDASPHSGRAAPLMSYSAAEQLRAVGYAASPREDLNPIPCTLRSICSRTPRILRPQASDMARLPWGGPAPFACLGGFRPHGGFGPHRSFGPHGGLQASQDPYARLLPHIPPPRSASQSAWPRETQLKPRGKTQRQISYPPQVRDDRPAHF